MSQSTNLVLPFFSLEGDGELGDEVVWGVGHGLLLVHLPAGQQQHLRHGYHSCQICKRGNGEEKGPIFHKKRVDQEQTMANTPDFLVTKFAVTSEAEEREDWLILS